MVLQCSPTLSQERLCCLSNCSTNAKIVCHVCNISMSGKLFCAPALQTLFPPLRQLANQAVGVVTEPSGIPPGGSCFICAQSDRSGFRMFSGTLFQAISYLQTKSFSQHKGACMALQSIIFTPNLICRLTPGLSFRGIPRDGLPSGVTFVQLNSIQQ